MGVFRPFSWTPDTLAPAGASAAGVITRPTHTPLVYQARIANPSSSWMYVRFGTSPLTGGNAATTGDMPIAPGSVEVFSLTGHTHWAAYGNGTISLNAGEGA